MKKSIIPLDKVVLVLGALAGFIYAGYNAYHIRLFAIETYGRVIHEFDPWFNYRATYVFSSWCTLMNTSCSFSSCFSLFFQSFHHDRVFLSLFLSRSLSLSFILFLSLSFSFSLFHSLSLSFILFLSLSYSFSLFHSLSLSLSLAARISPNTDLPSFLRGLIMKVGTLSAARWVPPFTPECRYYRCGYGRLLIMWLDLKRRVCHSMTSVSLSLPGWESLPPFPLVFLRESVRTHG